MQSQGIKTHVRILAFALAILAAGVMSIVQAFGQNYWVVDLGVLQGDNASYASGINNSGLVVGYSTVGGYPYYYHPFVYSNGVLNNIALPSGRYSAIPTAINNSGQIIAQVHINGGYYDSFLYSNDSIQNLGSLGGDSTVALGINSNGQAVGWSQIGTGYQDAFLYSNGSMQDLGSFGGNASGATAINSSGQIVGYFNISAYPYPSHAFLYSNGLMQDLGLLLGFYSEATGINDSGQVVGVFQANFNSASHAFLYSNGATQDLGVLSGGSSSYPTSINNSGQIVGYSSVNGSSIQHAFLYFGGVMQDLNNLVINTNIGFTLQFAGGINDAGQIIGSGINSNNQTHAFLLNPLPPSAPAITAQPQSQTVQAGSNVTFTVTVTGFPSPNYQWQFNGQNLDGQTAVSLSLNNVQFTTAGGYSGIVTNAYGSVTSSVAQLTVYTNLVFTPTNRTPQTTEIGSPTILTDTNHFKVYVNGNFVSGAALNPNKMTVVLTHGWNGSPSDWAEYVAQIIWKRIGSNAVNIVAWDWSAESKSDFFHLTDIAAKTPGEGKALGTNLVAALGANYSQRIHFIGHSLGTMVNAAAANYVHSNGFSWTNTQMTLCDDAEIAWGIGANGGWQFTTTLPQSLFRLIPNTSTSQPYWGQALPNQFAWADNYISAVGLLHTNAANAILSYTYPSIVGDINILMGEFNNFHSYAHFFYEDTIEPGIFNNGGQTNATYLGFINSWEGGGSASRQATNTFFYQDPNGLELNLAPTDFVTASAVLNARLGNFLSIGVSSAEDASPWYYLGINSVEAVGQVTGINSTVGLAINLLTAFGGGTPHIQSLNAQSGAVPKAGSAANTPAYAWIPLNVPADAVSLSFDFMLQGNGNQDSFQAALNGTNILSVETSLLQTNVTVNSGLINVSQYAGQQVELFLGIVGGTSTNAALTANNFQFYSILPPSLQIQMAGTNVALTWPLSGSGYVLQTTDNLTPPVAWTPVASASSIVNYQCTATAPVSEASRFYRLAPPGAGSPALQVTINPATAVNAGALWQVDGGAWQSSGDTVGGLTAGNHTVTFNTINNWNSPASQNVMVNNSSATASGTFVQQPGSLQTTISPAGAINAGALWQVDGGAWQTNGATVPGLTVGNHTVAFSFLGGWTNPASQILAINANQLTTANGNYVLVLDTTKPTNQITAPTAGLSVSNASYTITGNAGDNVYVAGVWYQLNGAGWNLATTSNGWTNWSAAVSLIPMTNSVKAFTVDAAGNVSVTNSVSFVCILNTPLTVSTNGLGSISPNDNGVLLTVGKSYSLAATAGTGFVFSNWTGGISLPSTILTNGTTLNFVMQSNLWLQANFRETAKPTLTVTSPKTGTKQTNATVNIVGTAKDDWKVTGVWCQVNGGTLTPATTTNKFTNWTAQVTLITGANTVKSFAQNGGGIYSTTNSLSLTH